MSRSYESSHRWITFELNLGKANYKLWMLLGECKSKIDHIAGVPLSPELRQKMHTVFLAKGVHATTAIEGNTLSESQVQLAIEGVLRTPPSQQYLEQEVRNILRACNRICAKVLAGEDLNLTPKLLKYFNRAVRHRLPQKKDCSCKSGEISEHGVVVGSVYRGAPREDCEYLLARLCDWLNGRELNSSDLDPVLLAVIKAIVAHLYVAWIHPFCDGNGRTARLVELSILLNASVPIPVAHLLSNHYNATRTEYYSQLSYASSSGGDLLPFIAYAVQGLRDQLAEQIEWISERQIDTEWVRFIGESFPAPPQPKHVRQRRLVEALGTNSVSFKDLMSLSPTVARDYARTSQSTASRDIAELLELGLIVMEPPNLIRAKREQILSLLPDRKLKQPTKEEDVKPRRGRPRAPKADKRK